MSEQPNPSSLSLDSLQLPLLSITSPTERDTTNQSFSSDSAANESLSDTTTTHSVSPTLNKHPHSLPIHPPAKAAHHRPHPGNPGGVKVPPGLVAKMAAMTKRKDNLPSSSSSPSSSTIQRIDPMAFIGDRPSSASSALNINTLARPNAAPSATILSSSMSTRRAKPMMKLGDMHLPPSACSSPFSAASSSGSTTSHTNQTKFLSVSGAAAATPFANFSKIVDPSGRLNFGGKAVVHSHGVDFSNGSSFSINMNELTLMEELGKGNYGTVQKVFHKPTKVVMAMKEIRLELDDSKLKAILTELDILHRATSDTIVEFYGAFFIESCVYYCMEYMDAGSLDKLAGADVPEPVLARVTGRVVEGLRFLKDELQTIHRDVKPTNVLINQKGETKLCDFGVSGQLERSLAKTNIGCQSYMAPERIQGERTGEVNTYTVSSDVWSLGISIIEFAIGHYPYPPETYSNIFAQLNAIVHGESPSLPSHLYSPVAIDFVNQCLIKNPKERPSYNDLLRHPFLLDEAKNLVDMVAWVATAIQQVKK
ncbi:hypothetical protein PCANC_08264 [Puccinia coronata f. sp. avenae]|uniref:mitogen-activated protein kinase kinase n=1 Tax=Puccinia coronata f. sp. avenae TaxID=200324 RepID=A0A2N5T5U1_9BASI|nr:hypothetical protein PCANC_08264 [Puccinia coronata f. sp. avenae]